MHNAMPGKLKSTCSPSLAGKLKFCDGATVARNGFAATDNFAAVSPSAARRFPHHHAPKVDTAAAADNAEGSAGHMQEPNKPLDGLVDMLGCAKDRQVLQPA